MQLIYESRDSTHVNLLASLLENAGIHCQVRNQIAGTLLGEDIRLNDYPVQLWVLDDDKVQEARQLLENGVSCRESDHLWRCDRCGEEMESQFSNCWNCGEARRDR